MAELNALNAHLTASQAAFRVTARRVGGRRVRPIVIHNHYRRGILNIPRARIRRGGRRKWPRKAENGTRRGASFRAENCAPAMPKCEKCHVGNRDNGSAAVMP